MSFVRRLLHTESKWNPKVMLGRVVSHVVPAKLMHRFKKHYYAYLISHRPETWMEGDAAICAKLIGPTDNVLDIGANIGSFALFMAKRAAKVYAFEPIPQTFDFLTNNMQKLKLSNVECLNFALSDTNQQLEMEIPKYHGRQDDCYYDARIKLPTGKPHWKKLTIAGRTLDALDLPKIGFIKCDAEYHEYWVLLGAIQTIRRDRPAMLIEVNPNPDDPKTSAYRVFDLLTHHGYSAYWYDGKELHLRKTGEKSQNYFFLRPEHLQRLSNADARYAQV